MPARGGPGSREGGARSMQWALDLLQDRQQRIAELTTACEQLRAQIAALGEAERQLADARDQYSDLYELSPVAYLTLTNGGLITAANAAAGNLFGRTPRLLVGRSFALLVTPGERSRLRRQLMAARRMRQPTTAELEVTVDGGTFPVEVITRAAQAGGYYTAVVDLRERRRAEQEKHRLAVEVELARAASQAKDQFLATLSHELRTPLTPVVAAAQALSEHRDQLPTPALDLVEVIRRNLGYEVRLIDDLLDVTRIAHGKFSVERAPVDLMKVLRDAADQIRPQAKEAGVELRVVLRGSRHLVGDGPRLLQAFGNLLRNAVQFTPPGGTVSLSSQSRGPVVLVRVRDTGQGIAPEDLPRIFERFSQGRLRHGRRKSGGLGLGLAIAHGIIDAQGGTVVARSAGLGRGATFEVALHAAPAPTTASAEPAAPAMRDATRGAKKILLVEDHPDTAEVMAKILAGEGHEVMVANSVQAALSLGRQPFDVLVSDIGLPDGTGLELMRELRARRPVSGIALSGYGTREDVARSRDAGFAMHLVKPVNVMDLIEAIAKLGRGKRVKAGRGSRG